jgi:cation diffusion facilitator CzcD-associated flavoprotein CzcO
MAAAQPYELCIVGAGITGLSLLLLLLDVGYDLTKVAIIDPHFDGGDLARRWTTVLSNTPWSKTLGALAATCPTVPLCPTGHTPLEPSQTAPLAELASLIRNTAVPALSRVRQIQAVATRAEYSSATGLWSVVAGSTPVHARRVILAPGAEPRTLPLGCPPSIPLEVALDAGRLRHYGVAGKKVLVVGTMHSGALVIRNLLKLCGAAKVMALYNTPTPFVWDRDNAYDGLKGEAAEIADAIQAGDDSYGPTVLELIPTSDMVGLLRAGRQADWAVYAMGFVPRETCELIVDGVPVATRPYDGATGALKEAPRAWGFGVAYPNSAPDGVHWDVSVAAFLEHMKRQLPALLS